MVEEADNPEVRTEFAAMVQRCPLRGRRDAQLLELLQFAFDQLQMDVQGIERISNLVRHTGCEQCQGLNAFALDSRKCLFPRFSRIVQNQREPQLPAPSPSSGAAYNLRKRGCG